MLEGAFSRCDLSVIRFAFCMAYRLSDNQACKWLHFKISSKQDDRNYMNEIRSYPNECSIIL